MVTKSCENAKEDYFHMQANRERNLQFLREKVGQLRTINAKSFVTVLLNAKYTVASDLPEASGAKGVPTHHDLGFTGAVQVTKVVFTLHSKYCLRTGSNNLVFRKKYNLFNDEITLSYLR